MNAKILYLQSFLYPYSSALTTVLAHTILSMTCWFKTDTDTDTDTNTNTISAHGPLE